MPGPLDPILAQIFASGEWETILRVGIGAESMARASADLISRFPGLTQAAAEYLAGQAQAAYEAAQDVIGMEPAETLPYSDLPRVPSEGIPGAQPGDIVVIGAIKGPGMGPKGGDIAVAAHVVFGVTPSAGEVAVGLVQAGQAVAGEYENLEEIEEAELEEIMEEIMGVFVVS